MSELSLTPKEKSAVKAMIVDLNSRYGSKSQIGVINWKDGTFTTPGQKLPKRAFKLESGARPGTFRVSVSGQSGVTKAVAAKPVKAVKAAPAPAVVAPVKPVAPAKKKVKVAGGNPAKVR